MRIYTIIKMRRYIVINEQFVYIRINHKIRFQISNLSIIIFTQILKKVSIQLDSARFVSSIPFTRKQKFQTKKHKTRGHKCNFTPNTHRHAVLPSIFPKRPACFIANKIKSRHLFPLSLSSKSPSSFTTPPPSVQSIHTSIHTRNLLVNI